MSKKSKKPARRAAQRARARFPNKEPAPITSCPVPTPLQATLIAMAVRDCDQEHIECFRRCWNSKPPWPIRRGSSGHYRYCQSKCLAEYMACLAEQAVEQAFESMSEAVEWLAQHPEVVVGTIVVIGGVAFVVASGGSGGLILVPAAL